MTPEEIANAAISQMNKRITDEIFLTIQNDPELMHEYLRTISDTDCTLDTMNQTIGKRVKEAYGLSNSDREVNPACTLIQSHQRFE